MNSSGDQSSVDKIWFPKKLFLGSEIKIITDNGIIPEGSIAKLNSSRCRSGPEITFANSFLEFTYANMASDY